MLYQLTPKNFLGLNRDKLARILRPEVVCAALGLWTVLSKLGIDTGGWFKLS